MGFSLDFSLSKTAIVLLAVLSLASFDLSQRVQRRSAHYLFACIFGSAISLGLIRVTHIFLESSIASNPIIAALAVLFLFFLYRALFGPWEAETKATVLGTFLFWVILHLYGLKEPAERTAQILAILIGLIPAGIWSMLFLQYHRTRVGHVCLMFFAGMLSTVPILFYDVLVRRGVELQYFLFRIVPESFSTATHSFVYGYLPSSGGIRSTLLATFLSFLIVGFIEECSKFWVLRRSGQKVFTSIDDVLQFSIVVAIGFAFAENVVGSGYFIQFVREYLVQPETPDIVGFASNVVGRAVLTNMVHIVSTGVLGYFLGLSFFAGPYMEEVEERGGSFPLTRTLSLLLRVDRVRVFQVCALLTGLLSAIFLHGLFNFLVTLPDLLPGQPRTLGDIFQSPEGSPLHSLALLLLPSLLYVVGGFWLLSGLFLREENVTVRGLREEREVFIRPSPVMG